MGFVEKLWKWSSYTCHTQSPLLLTSYISMAHVAQLMNDNHYIIINWSSYFIQAVLIFTHFSGTLGYHIIFSHRVSLSSLGSDSCPESSPSFFKWSWLFRGVLVKRLTDCSLLRFVWCFSYDNTGIGVKFWGGKAHRQMQFLLYQR